MASSGRLLGGRYELGALVASGGMGRVWRARDTVLNRAVAVKVLRSEYTDDAAFLSRFRAEAQHAAALHHPNIASVFDYGEVDEDGERLAYLVMELVEGESLAALLARQGRLGVAASLQVVRGTAAALAVAHGAGLVHRDIKPGNVLVTLDGAVKITDFGIAWSASSVPLTRTGQVIGTAHYLSPEQAQGDRATPASDVYALGAVAYECLAGRRAFEGENSVQIAVKQIREDPEPLPQAVPADVRALVERAMAKDPARRFPDGGALLQAVDDVLAGSGLPAAAPLAGAAAVPGADGGRTGTAVMPLPLGPSGPAAPMPSRQGAAAATPSRRRRPTALLLGALAALLLVAGVLLATTVLDGDGTTATQPTTTQPTTTSPVEQTTEPAQTAVALDPAAYVGRPVAEVQAELAALGLTVALEQVQTADVADGLVTELTPIDGLLPGSTVTVRHAVAPPPPPAPAPADDGGGDEGGGGEGGNEGGDGDRGGGDDKEEEAEERGNGNGNGRGNGND
jgi:serine/threonine-protein kinase